MSRPQLNSKQHQWLSKFRSENPNPCYELREVREGLCGDCIVVLEGTEQLPLPAVPEFASAFPVSTAAASAAVVPSQAWSKATTVTVKAFN